MLKEVLTLTSSFQLPGHLADWISSQHKVPKSVVLERIRFARLSAALDAVSAYDCYGYICGQCRSISGGRYSHFRWSLGGFQG